MTPEQQSRYESAVHGIQSAVAFLITKGERLAEPKHLRTGIDTSKADMEALVLLLMDKGVFSLEEYEEAIVNAAERELERYTERARKVSGFTNITFK